MNSNYYWREYTGGEIPKDAIVGGTNTVGENIYIGEVFELGLLCVKQIDFSKDHENIAKILCGLGEDFMWVSSEDLAEIDTNGTIPGCENPYFRTFIARRIHNGELEIANVWKFKTIPGQTNTFSTNTTKKDVFKSKRVAVFGTPLHQSNLTQGNFDEFLFFRPYTIGAFIRARGYYWREYNGTIPEDALMGGRDINHKNIYIGQEAGFDGFSVVPIFPGVTEKQNDRYVKILCGNAHFEWITSTAGNLHILLLDKEAVIGGYTPGKGYVAIGRISCENTTVIASLPFYDSNVILSFERKGIEQLYASYQVLTISNP